MVKDVCKTYGVLANYRETWGVTYLGTPPVLTQLRQVLESYCGVCS